jgi:hypothetical protein
MLDIAMDSLANLAKIPLITLSWLIGAVLYCAIVAALLLPWLILLYVIALMFGYHL